jgi:hypothetical protein
VTGVITKIEWTNPHSFIYLVDGRKRRLRKLEVRKISTERALSHRLDQGLDDQSWSSMMLREGTRLQENVCAENNTEPARFEQLEKDGVDFRRQ